MSKMILNYHDQLEWVHSVEKTKQDNDVIDHTGVIYVKNDAKLSSSIRSDADCDENQIWQLSDLLYRYDLR